MVLVQLTIITQMSSVLAQNYRMYQNSPQSYQNPNAAVEQQYPQFQYQGQPQLYQQVQPPVFQRDQSLQYQQQGQIQYYPQVQGAQYSQGQQPQLYQQPQQNQQDQSQSQNMQWQPSTAQMQRQTPGYNSTTQYGTGRSSASYQSTTQQPITVQYDQNPKDCLANRVRGDFCDSAQQRQMFYFDSVMRMCQPFMYNGCNGNGNRFESAAECKQMCVDGSGANFQQRDDSNSGFEASMKIACSAEYSTDNLIPQQCNNGQSCSTGYHCSGGFCCPTPEYICTLRYDSGKFSDGGEKSDRYFYTNQYKTCMRFSFYGTLGNANNFPDYNSCMRTCGIFAQ